LHFVGKSKQYDYANHSPVLSTIQPKRKLSYKEAQKLIIQQNNEKFQVARKKNLAQQLCKHYDHTLDFSLLQNY